MSNYFFDSDQVRYELYQTNDGKNYNWLFFPGGPGGDSSYLRSLVDELQLPGNIWLIDLPGNGSNLNDSYSDNFDKWFELFPLIVTKFDNPIVVGHSFGGMLPLLYSEFEGKLKGCVILNSTPVLWMEEAAAYAKQFDLPDLTDDMQTFISNPNQETFNNALNTCMPYYFPKKTLEKGRQLFLKVPFQYLPAVWGQIRALEGKLLSKWVPQAVPTLIIGAKYDCICPFSLFNNDERFHRKNIKLLLIEDGGHCPWIENPKEVNKAFKEFIIDLNK
ncbi:MAG: alpha/beta hydrolase [Parachlamydiaceae bacterium]|nr:alpha/beta hydrolase [Parachlamydiaceae bacterium]